MAWKAFDNDSSQRTSMFYSVDTSKRRLTQVN